MNFKQQALIIALGTCIAAPALAHDLSIATIGNQGFLARMGGAFARDTVIGYMFSPSTMSVNGTEIVDPASTNPSLPRQIINVLTGINLGVTLWTLGKEGLKKSLGAMTGREVALFSQAYDSGMDVYVLMEAARDSYKAMRAIIDEAQAHKAANPAEQGAVSPYIDTAMVPAYAATFVPNFLASYYSFVLGANLGAKYSAPLAPYSVLNIPIQPLAFAYIMWNVGIALCMTAKEAIAALGETVGLTDNCKACSAIADAAQELSYVATGITLGLLSLYAIKYGKLSVAYQNHEN